MRKEKRVDLLFMDQSEDRITSNFRFRPQVCLFHLPEQSVPVLRPPADEFKNDIAEKMIMFIIYLLI